MSNMKTLLETLPTTYAKERKVNMKICKMIAFVMALTMLLSTSAFAASDSVDFSNGTSAAIGYVSIASRKAVADTEPLWTMTSIKTRVSAYDSDGNKLGSGSSSGSGTDIVEATASTTERPASAESYHYVYNSTYGAASKNLSA